MIELKIVMGEMGDNPSPKIIVAHFLKEIYLLKNEFRKSFKIGIITGETLPQERLRIEKDFQSGNLNLLLLNRAARFSHNFSRAGEIIFYSTPLDLLTREQLEARALLRKHLLVVDLICRDTIEEDYVESLRKKENESQMVERLVRRIKNANIVN